MRFEGASSADLVSEVTTSVPITWPSKWIGIKSLKKRFGKGLIQRLLVEFLYEVSSFVVVIWGQSKLGVEFLFETVEKFISKKLTNSLFRGRFVFLLARF